METKEKTYGSALNAMQKYCAKRETCIFDLKRKLGYYNLSEENKSKILDELIKEGFVNEERYARIFVRDKFRLNKWGKIKIGYHLRTKGIPGNIIEIALQQEISEEDYIELLNAEIAKKAAELNNQDNGKIVRTLQSKGFELDLIMQHLKI